MFAKRCLVVKIVRFKNGREVPALGQGTWHMGRSSTEFRREVDALRCGMDHGMTLIDTAEMYHDAERVVGEAISGRRDEVFLVSKVLPSNASLKGTAKACENSLRKLGADKIDLYLLHWPGNHPLEDTIDAFGRLVEQGKIDAWGVSNFDTAEMISLSGLSNGRDVQTNQILYNLALRNVEWSLLPWCQDRNLPVMAYSPLNQGEMNFAELGDIARRHDATAQQIALAWLLHQESIIVIPKSSDREHVKDNARAGEISLGVEDLAELDRIFPPPVEASPLPVL